MRIGRSPYLLRTFLLGLHRWASCPRSPLWGNHVVPGCLAGGCWREATAWAAGEPSIEIRRDSRSASRPPCRGRHLRARPLSIRWSADVTILTFLLLQAGPVLHLLAPSVWAVIYCLRPARPPIENFDALSRNRRRLVYSKEALGIMHLAPLLLIRELFHFIFGALRPGHARKRSKKKSSKEKGGGRGGLGMKMKARALCCELR